MKLRKFTKILGIITFVLVVVCIGCSIFVKNINYGLNVEKQKLNNKINALLVENEKLSVEVDELSEYNKVVALIKQQGLNSSTVITLGN